VGKIIIRLTGGLGNQMHQYAFGIYLRKHIGYELLIDESFLNLNANKLNITKRNFELYRFNVTKKKYNGILSNYFLNLLLKSNAFLRLIFLYLFRIKNLYNNTVNFVQFKTCKIIYLDGVFGTISQYNEVKNEIKAEFNIANEYKKLKEEVENSIIKHNSLAIHVRRTDYLKPESVHVVLGLEYYKQAIEIILEKVSIPTIYLFGDDEDWIKSNLITLYPEGIFINRKGDNSVLFDFLAIGYCDNIITSNSSYSWWAAFLGLDYKKNIVAPLKWLKNENHSLIDQYPETWIKF
jgi:hypothetical protein